MTADYSKFDGILKALQPYSDDLKNGLTSHVPMAAEALTVLGFPDQAVSWATARLDDIVPRQDAQTPVTDADWQDGLGAYGRFSDWQVLFAEELAAGDWRTVLEKWVPRLAPGFVGAATHGIIRTAHAVRLLEDSDTPARRGELADGLALWGYSYQTLPEGDAGIKGLTPREAFAQIPLVPEDQRRNQGAITYALTALQDQPDFAPVIDLIDPDNDTGEMVAGLANLLVGVFLAHARDGLSSIVFTHSLTGLAAAMTIAPHVSSDGTRALIRYGWQGVAGLYACYGDAGAKPQTLDPETPDQIKAAVLAHGDDHVIKLSEVCLRFYEMTGNDDFLRAPQLSRTHLEPDQRGLG